ncbi:MAG: ATP-dependent DNA helicase [Ilumatobacteraceae bacterium]
MTTDGGANPTLDALDDTTRSLVGAETRPGQREMAGLVADAIASGRHLVVEAGTGTGKTLAYLVPAIVAGRTTMVVTATKALQDQLAVKDLPFVHEHLAAMGHDADWAVLKGRSNYLCLQRLQETTASTGAQLDLEGLTNSDRAAIQRLAEWARATNTGDRAELDWNPSDQTWRSVSVGPDECPGANRCPAGDECFAELARARASTADIVVVNTHLYGLDVASGGSILPEHDVVVFDEAHVLEDVMSDTVGVQIAPSRFSTVAQAVRRFLDDADLVGSIAGLSGELERALAPFAGQRLALPLPDPIGDALGEASAVLARVGETIQNITTDVDEAAQRRLRALQLIGRTGEAIDTALTATDDSVPFVSGTPAQLRLEVAPLDVGPILSANVWSRRTAVLTSATIPSSLISRVGLPVDSTDVRRVDSPFDYTSQGLLYCALHLPPPRSASFRDLVADELVALITAAGGRTLALFTSWAAMDHAPARVRDRVDVPILTQRDLPKPALVTAFAESEHTCLFATTGMFQGVDVPGRTLSLVVIDKLPFPRPDDPLLSARRERAGATAFAEIDVPRAATLLAQATGRLIRTTADRGVVAVLDPRLGTARYRWDIVHALPPMRRTRHRSEAEALLSAIRDEAERAPDQDDINR